MFRRLFGGGGEAPPESPYALAPERAGRGGMYTLRAMGDTRVLAAEDAAAAGDWAGVKRALEPFDLGREHGVVGIVAMVDGVQDWIGRAIEEDEEHRAAAQLISGVRHIHWGWEARTDAQAVHVTQEQWRVFHERLHVAEELLLAAAEARPDWVSPWRQLLTSGRGMSLGADVNEARLDAALRRDPLDVSSHIEWVSQLQPRWGGEPGAALAFARAAVARAPHGHRMGRLIADAHIEEWVESSHGDCLETPAVQAELREAADRSILHPAYERRPGWQGDFNTFAMALHLAGERHTVRRVFQALDGAYTGWNYLADAEKVFAAHHRRA
ncbi:hypothetical protein [Streptomyces sp. NPDC060194]|uniref:hypothetical protein n=1 Tax=Streptomyces sp. NPDC060194 TaxID=3347069 RepID=UPI00365A429D